MQLNLTIVWTRDRQALAEFMVEVTGFDPPEAFGPFLAFHTESGVSLDLLELPADRGVLTPQRYAFLVTDAEFDGIIARLQARKMPYWAEHTGGRPGEINTNHGGRGVYFADPTGHHLDFITRPYGPTRPRTRCDASCTARRSAFAGRGRQPPTIRRSQSQERDQRPKGVEQPCQLPWTSSTPPADSRPSAAIHRPPDGRGRRGH